MKTVFTLFVVLFVILISCSGCSVETTTPAASTNPYNSATATSSVTSPPNSPTSTIPVYDITLSFPDGAPPLNQSKALQGLIRANVTPLDMSLKVILPEGLELLTGELTWSGLVPAYEEVIAVNATVKAVKTGNWAVGYTHYFNADKTNIGQGNIYLSISENSAKWRPNPSYDAPTGISPPTSTDLPTPIPTHT